MVISIRTLALFFMFGALCYMGGLVEGFLLRHVIANSATLLNMGGHIAFPK